MSYPATVELLNTIPTLVLTGNKVPLKFQASENFLESAGSKAKIILPWTAVAVADEYFDIDLFGSTYRFTCKAAPDTSGLQFHDNSASGTLAEWVALMAEDLKANYLIARYYNLTVDDDEITIEAKEVGSAYTLDFTAGAGIDCVPDETSKTGTDRSIRAFYNVIVLLHCAGEFVGELAIPVDDDGLATVDIQNMLKAYLLNDFSWPESDADFIYYRSGAVAPWQFYFGERWGSGDYKAMQLSSTYYVMNAGVSWMQQAKYNASDSSFWAKLTYNNYFLSWAPTTRIVAPSEPVKLYKVNDTLATTLKLKIKRYISGAAQSTETLETLADTVAMGLYEFVVTPAKANLAGLSNETLTKYEVWIENQSDVRVSEIRTFVLDYTYYENTRYFLFRNSLGAYEIVRSTGVIERGDSYISDTSSFEMEDDYTSLDREMVIPYKGENQRFRLSLGWLSRYANGEEYRNWLRDFALSKEVYQCIGNTIKPVVLISDSLAHGRDRNNLSEFSFEFMNAFTDEHFTKEITTNLFNESFASDFEKAQ